MAIEAKYGRIDVPGIPDDEPIFILRAQDVIAPATIAFYGSLRHFHGSPADRLPSIIRRFVAWPKKKIPD